LTTTLRALARAVERLSLFVALLVVLLIAGLSYRAWSEFGRDSKQARNELALINGTSALLLSITDAETGQRGFLLTGEDRYLKPYEQARGRLPVILGALQVAVSLDPGQRENVNQLTPMVMEKMAELARTLELRRSAGLEEALAAVRTNRGQIAMERIRAICGEIQTTASATRSRAADQGRANANQIGLIATTGSGILFALLALASVAIRQSTQRRQDLIAALQVSEAHVKEARDWLQTTLGSIGDGVIATDAAGHVVFLNDVATELTGWTQEQAAGLDLEKLFVITSEDTAVAVENPVRKALREGRIIGVANHTKLERKDGTFISIDDTAAPIRSSDGHAIGVVLVFRDVTADRERQRQEEHSRNALASANKDLQQFAFAASHDLREPLRTIRIFTERLELTAPALQEKHRKELQFIVDGVDRMESLVNSLLEYATAGAVSQRPLTEIRVEEALVSTLENLRASIEESHAVITHGALPILVADPAHLALVFQNLIANAIKYRRGDAPRIHIAAKRDSYEWIFSVQDDGVGIAPQYHEAVFDIFKRLHDQSLSGSGIGLATCRRIVDRYQGRMWVESLPGKGSTFFFSLTVR
jgi:PAS domain S-box-containing protein